MCFTKYWHKIGRIKTICPKGLTADSKLIDVEANCTTKNVSYGNVLTFFKAYCIYQLYIYNMYFLKVAIIIQNSGGML